MLSIARLVGIGFVFAGTAIAWLVLGGITTTRTSEQHSDLGGEVAELWGAPQTQSAPALTFRHVTTIDRVQTETVNGVARTVNVRESVEQSLPVGVDSTNVDVALHLDPRRKGLIWYRLYDVRFAGRWAYTHDDPRSGTLDVAFAFPDPGGLYDGFTLTIDGVDRAADLEPTDGRVVASLALAPGQRVEIGVTYTSRGVDAWTYAPTAGVASLDAFHLAITTDFRGFDFPPQGLSPSRREARGAGELLAWSFERVVTGRSFGVVMPERTQPGELAASLAFSAPISLFFFFLLLVVLAALQGIDVHPFNYAFLAGAFFAFHLVFAYSADHLPVEAAFAIASAVSVGLVVSYLRLVVSPRFAVVQAGTAQLLYLVGFSLAHFWKGLTGLTVTVLAVLTLFLLMQLTGRLRWSELLTARDTAPGPAR